MLLFKISLLSISILTNPSTLPLFSHPLPLDFRFNSHHQPFNQQNAVPDLPSYAGPGGIDDASCGFDEDNTCYSITKAVAQQVLRSNEHIIVGFPQVLVIASAIFNGTQSITTAIEITKSHTNLGPDRPIIDRKAKSQFKMTVDQLFRVSSLKFHIDNSTEDASMFSISSGTFYLLDCLFTTKKTGSIWYCNLLEMSRTGSAVVEDCAVHDFVSHSERLIYSTSSKSLTISRTELIDYSIGKAAWGVIELEYTALTVSKFAAINCESQYYPLFLSSYQPQAVFSDMVLTNISSTIYAGAISLRSTSDKEIIFRNITFTNCVYKGEKYAPSCIELHYQNVSKSIVMSDLHFLNIQKSMDLIWIREQDASLFVNSPETFQFDFWTYSDRFIHTYEPIFGSKVTSTFSDILRYSSSTFTVSNSPIQGGRVPSDNPRCGAMENPCSTISYVIAELMRTHPGIQREIFVIDSTVATAVQAMSNTTLTGFVPESFVSVEGPYMEGLSGHFVCSGTIQLSSLNMEIKSLSSSALFFLNNGKLNLSSVSINASMSTSVSANLFRIESGSFSADHLTLMNLRLGLTTIVMTAFTGCSITDSIVRNVTFYSSFLTCPTLIQTVEITVTNLQMEGIVQSDRSVPLFVLNATVPLITNSKFEGFPFTDDFGSGIKDVCQWEGGMMKFQSCETTIQDSGFSNLPYGAIHVDRGTLTLHNILFMENGVEKGYVGQRRNVWCSTMGVVNLQNIVAEKDASGLWISHDKSCTINAISPQSGDRDEAILKNLFFQPQIHSFELENDTVRLFGKSLYACGTTIVAYATVVVSDMVPTFNCESLNATDGSMLECKIDIKTVLSLGCECRLNVTGPGNYTAISSFTLINETLPSTSIVSGPSIILLIFFGIVFLAFFGLVMAACVERNRRKKDLDLFKTPESVGELVSRYRTIYSQGMPAHMKTMLSEISQEISHMTEDDRVKARSLMFGSDLGSIRPHSAFPRVREEFSGFQREGMPMGSMPRYTQSIQFHRDTEKTL
ncbi:hypothetical protein BLNAU_1705 [Blattamonas nauphoetae]|uniref:Transmembrane protein n=1 Tax=Blattamonas nauphoetae TaxID=2049346 RepID=A0ABQ9YHE4_9EUKA|nr:hypothetical protein BLNAU_1705 [Blattamonas nauphoetae]